jgi:hypothetical protein
MPRRNDDESLSDDQLLIRAIWDSRDAFTQTEDGNFRPSSAAFIDRRSSEVSVFVADLTDLDEIRARFPSFGLVSVSVGLVRSLGYIVAATPEEDDPADPSHRVLCPGPNLGTSDLKKAAKSLALKANWIQLPDSIANL